MDRNEPLEPAVKTENLDRPSASSKGWISFERDWVWTKQAE